MHRSLRARGAGAAPKVPTQHSIARTRRCTGAGVPQATAASPGQQQQQPPRLQQQQQQRRRFREGPLPPPLTNKPFVVRIAGRTSSIQGAAGAITKRLQTDDLIRVAAIDSGSIAKAALALSVANTMIGVNRNQMLVFQPMLVTNDEDAPKVPRGSMVMYTSQIIKGEVVAENWMAVKDATDKQQLAGAIAARVREAGHTILECYGSAAVTTAIQALALARRYLKATEQDVACLSASGRKPLEDAAEGVVADGSEAAAGVTAAAGGSEAAAAAAAAVGAEGSSGSSSQYPATCHRLVVLECKPSQPRKLLVKQHIGTAKTG